MANPQPPRTLPDILALGSRAQRRAAANAAGGEVQRQYQQHEYSQRKSRFAESTPLSVVRGHAGAEQAELLGFELPIAGIRAERQLGKLGSAVHWRTTYPKHVDELRSRPLRLSPTSDADVLRLEAYAARFPDAVYRDQKGRWFFRLPDAATLDLLLAAGVSHDLRIPRYER